MSLEPGTNFNIDEEIVKAKEVDLSNADALAFSQVKSMNSIAISLKRIADILADPAKNPFTAPINQYGEGIGDAIQGQIIRGNRGVDQYEGG